MSGSPADVITARRHVSSLIRFHGLLLVVVLGHPANGADAPNFNRDVRPILSDRCFACHGPDAVHREADLRLDDFQSLTRDRDGYNVVTPKNPGASELISRITTDDPDLRMPPPELGKDLTDAEIEILRQWIAGGAEVRAHWAYVPPENRPAPTPKRIFWASNWIDQFVLSRLDRENLVPSADADAVTLLRRLYFDLTGLPPKPADVAQFAADPSEAKYKQIVDRLLESDAHAERLAVLDRALAGFLGEPLSLHCRLANISGTSVILHTDSPVWSARLRYQLPQILECLNQHYPEANLLRADVRVKLPERS